jgi:hypothetical protein
MIAGDRELEREEKSKRWIVAGVRPRRIYVRSKRERERERERERWKKTYRVGHKPCNLLRPTGI